MKKYRSYFIYASFFILISIGIEYEFSAYANGELTFKQYQLIGSSVLLLLFYILPLAYLLRYWQREWRLPKHLLAFAIMSGCLVAGWTSALGNDLASSLLSPLFSNQAFFTDWEASLTAPFIEEPLKLLAALFALYFFKRRSARAAFIAGAGSGLGFQISEYISYAYTTALDTPSSTIADTFARLSGFLSSHWMMSSLVTLGCIWIFFSHSKRTRIRGIALCLLTVMFHFIWNSPYTGIETPFSIHVAILSGLYCLLFYISYQKLQANQPTN